MATPIPKIELIEDSHEYTLGDRRLTSVTTVIEAVLREKSDRWKPEHRLRGTMVHAIVHAINDGVWSPNDTVIPEGFDRDKIINRGFAYEKWKQGVGFVAEASEQIVYSELYGIAGKFDTIGTITRGGYAGLRAVVDAKSGEPGAGSVLQVAGYDILSGRKDIGAHVVLHLREDGAPRPIYRTGREMEQDKQDFLSVLKVFSFMKRSSLIP